MDGSDLLTAVDKLKNYWSLKLGIHTNFTDREHFIKVNVDEFVAGGGVTLGDFLNFTILDEPPT